MLNKKGAVKTGILFLFASFLAGCASQLYPSPTLVSTPVPRTSSSIPVSTTEQLSPSSILSDYAFPETIDPTRQYLFYLHGKIIQDQGIPAVSPEFGEYEYRAILEKLKSNGLVVISEQRAKNTAGIVYAQRIAGQVTALLKAGVPAKRITVEGASQGAWITVYVSHLLENKELNFVLLAVCHPGNAIIKL